MVLVRLAVLNARAGEPISAREGGHVGREYDTEHSYQSRICAAVGGCALRSPFGMTRVWITWPSNMRIIMTGPPMARLPVGSTITQPSALSFCTAWACTRETIV